MFRKILSITLALCLAVGIAVQISNAQEPKTIEERVAVLEYRIEELTKQVEEQNQRLVLMLEFFQEQLITDDYICLTDDD